MSLLDICTQWYGIKLTCHILFVCSTFFSTGLVVGPNCCVDQPRLWRAHGSPVVPQAVCWSALSLGRAELSSLAVVCFYIAAENWFYSVKKIKCWPCQCELVKRYAHSCVTRTTFVSAGALASLFLIIQSHNEHEMAIQIFPRIHFMEIKRTDESRGQRAIMRGRTATLTLAPPVCGPSA